MNKYVFFQKHEKRRIAVILTMLICFAGLFSACGKKDENKEEKQKEPVILNPAADDPNLSDGEWAYDIWKTAIDKLYAEGAVSKSDISEDEYFKFETEGIAWSSPEAKAEVNVSITWCTRDLNRMWTKSFTAEVLTELLFQQMLLSLMRFPRRSSISSISERTARRL